MLGMKLAILLAPLLFLPLAYSEIIGVERFDYPDGPIAEKNGGTFWDYDNVSPAHTGTASNWDSPFGTPTVTRGRLLTSDNSVAKREYNGDDENSGAVNEGNVAKKVYYRVSVTTGATVGESDYFGFSSLDFEEERLYFGKRGGSTTFGVEEVGVDGSNGSATIQPDTTYVLVAIVDYANDFIRLYVNPDLNVAEPGPSSAAASRDYFGTNWSTAVRFSSDTSVSWDDLVVATTWEDLGPATDPAPIIAADYAAITNTTSGQQVAGFGLPGSVARHGVTSFPVLWDDTGLALMAAGRYEDGTFPAAARAVVCAHDGILTSTGAPPTADTASMLNLVEAAAKWASRKTNPSTITVGCGEGISNAFWADRGYSTKSVSTAMLSSTSDLSGVDVFVFHFHSGYTASALAKIQAFTANGGGIVCGATPWALTTGLTDAANVLTPFGLTLDHYPYWNIIEPLGPPALDFTATVSTTAPSTLYSALKGSEALIREKAGTRSMSLLEKSIAANSISQVIALRKDIALLNSRLETLDSSYGIIAPTAANPLEKASQPVEAMLARYQSGKYDALTPAQLFAHPCADDFPGAPLAGGTVSRNISVNGNTSADFYMNQGDKPVRFETGVYAAPGATITVTIPANKVAAGLQAHISPNGTEDESWNQDTWTFFPKLWRRVPLTATTTQTGHVLGGLVTILVPAGSNLGTFNVSVSGGIPAPTFTLGVNTEAQWNNTLKNHPAPFGFIRTDKLTIYVERQQLAALSNPLAVANHWKTVMDTADEYYGYTPWRKRGEAMSSSRYVSAGLAYAGYPTENGWGTGGQDEFLNHAVENGSWGNYHELGHGYQDNFDDAFGIATHAEVDVNLMPAMLFSMVHHISPWENKVTQFYNAETRNASRAAFMARPAAEQTWDHACDFNQTVAAYDFYFTIGEAFGWQAYRTAFSRLMNYLQNPAASTDTPLKNLNPNDPNFKRNRFYILFCDATGRNLDIFFQRYGLGVPGRGYEISASAKNHIAAKNYPVWTDYTPPTAIISPPALNAPRNFNGVIHTFGVEDVDPGETFTYSLSSGNADGAFAIDPVTGALRRLLPTTENSRTLSVTVSSNGLPVNGERHSLTSDVQIFNDTIVTNLGDEDDGDSTLSDPSDISLREAVKYSLSGLITLPPDLSGKTLTLTHIDGDMEINTSHVTIDASALPGGITLHGNNTSRHFFVGSGKSLTLRGLTLTGGNGSGVNTFVGGAILNDGTLTMTRCTLSGNATNYSGAIENTGTATLTQCTLSGNSADTNTGAITNSGTLTLVQCTLSGNSAPSSGAIANFGMLTLTNTIIAGNSASSSPDFLQSGTITRNGVNLIGKLDGSGLTASDTVLTGDPKLSPLGYFGGPVQTMHPLIGSPAIDAAGETDPGGTDARGFPRFVDGNSSSPDAQLDIGAVEAGPLRMVSFTSDPGNSSSLRGRIASSVEPGARIGFLTDPNTPIVLGSELSIPATANGLFIDASNLTAPVTISGDNLFRVFRIPAAATVAMHSLRIVNGISNNGGGILNAGTLSLLHSTLSENDAATGGGGIYNAGTLAITSSTLSGNLGSLRGGGIDNAGTLAITSSTLSGNDANGNGGGIYNAGTLAITSSTLSGNSSSIAGGGISNAGTLALNHSIVTSNTSANLSGTAPTGSQNLTTGDAILAPLGNYGGPTQTMPPLPGSPAIDAAPSSTRTTDQRGFPLFGVPDIGAAELQGFGPIPNLNTTEDTAVTSAPFAVGGIGVLVGTSSNTTLVPNANITFNGSGATRTVTVTPAPNRSGITTITVQDSFGAPQLTFTVTVTAVNDAPTISDIPDDSLTEDRRTGVLNFTIGDVETAATALTLTRSSSNTTLVPLANIVLGGSGANRTVTVTPAANQSGTATITVTVSDGTATASDTFVLTFVPVNDAPTITGIADRTINEDTNTGAVPFTIGDVETAATALTLTRASSNTALVPLANVVLGGSGANRTVTVTPAANQFGTATITVNVSDGDVTEIASETFVVTVNAVNDAPSFTKGANLSIVNNVGAQTVTGWATALSAGPANESTQTLGFTVTNSNNALFTAQPAIAANGTLTFTPATTAGGSATVTVRINDNGGTANGGVNQSAAQTFTITSTFPTLVTNNANTGTGSLRQAIANAAINPGAETVTFAPGLTGTIVLTSEIPITDTAGVTIDATALPAGLTLSGGNTTRHFQVQAGKTLTLRGLTLTAGKVTGEGGAVHNAGTLNLDRCTFSGNASTSNGGAIASIGTLSLTNCTLSGNSASGTGGGILSNGTSTVLFSTISGNTAVEGGGVSTLQTFHLTASIVAGNTATTALSNIKGPLTTNAQNLTTGDPLIAPLGAYGGLTFTMPPLPGSPAINAATGRTRTADQRGFPSVGFPDLGAAEFQGNTDLRRYWSTDWDGDNSPFGLEFALGTNPRSNDPVSPNNLVLSAAANGNPVITFGRNPAANSTTTWRLTRSTTLSTGSFTEIFRFSGPTGTGTTTGSTFRATATSFQVTDTTPPPGKAFYRIEAISP
ncbi:MAG: hypothetical protein RLZZ505_1088 [Verrucomicrobiota bacterium]